MVISDKNKKYLLFIEPTIEQRSGAPINDEYTMLLRLALSEAEFGTSNRDKSDAKEEMFYTFRRYNSVYTCCDGIKSTNYDIKLRNGLITHSLCVHYLMWFRPAIPISDWDKLKDLQRHYGRSDGIKLKF